MKIEFSNLKTPKFAMYKMKEVNASSGDVFTLKSYESEYFIFVGEGEWIRVSGIDGDDSIVHTINLYGSESDYDKYGDLQASETEKKAKLVFI